MGNHTREPNVKESNAGKAYRGKLARKGSTFTDTPCKADDRDKAKIEKALSGESQKIDFCSSR